MKKSFAKYMALFLAAMFTFSVVGCGKDKAEQQEPAVTEEQNTENDALQEVAFTSIETDGNRRAELEADCPDEFAYCRVFVVGSKDNPSPVCDLLQMSMSK